MKLPKPHMVPRMTMATMGQNMPVTAHMSSPHMMTTPADLVATLRLQRDDEFGLLVDEFVLSVDEFGLSGGEFGLAVNEFGLFGDEFGLIGDEFGLFNDEFGLFRT